MISSIAWDPILDIAGESIEVPRGERRGTRQLAKHNGSLWLND